MYKLSLDNIKSSVHIDLNKDCSAIIFLFLGILLIILGIKYLVQNMDFIAASEKTTAVVTELNVHYGSGGKPHDIYTTTFQYDVDGNTYTGESESIDYKPDWEEGSTIDIYYNPDNPYTSSVYSNKDMLGLVFLRLGTGIVLSAIGILILVLHIRKRQQNTFR